MECTPSDMLVTLSFGQVSTVSRIIVMCWRWSKPNIIFAPTSESRSSRVGSKSIIFCNSVASRALGSSSAVVNISIYLLARCPPVFCHINIHTCKLLDKIIILQLMTKQFRAPSCLLLVPTTNLSSLEHLSVSSYSAAVCHVLNI